MYGKRVKIFIALSSAVLIVCVLRLMQMQLSPEPSVYEKIAELELKRGLTRQLNTIRGRILDRKDRVLAVDELRYQLNINYKLSCFADERVRQAKLLQARKKSQNDEVVAKVQQEIESGAEAVRQIIDKCTIFGVERQAVADKIANINDRIWNLRTFLAWVRNNPNPELIAKYDSSVSSVPMSEARRDFEQRFTDPNNRMLLTIQVDDIAELDRMWPLFELNSDEEIFAAQVEFMQMDGVEVMPQPKRIYPFGSAACQTIGWVGPATQQADKELFSEDRLSSYLAGEVCGREDGVEYVCESILRGRRGEAYYDSNGVRIERAERKFGKDVKLSIDIELQRKIEQRFTDCGLNPNCEAPSAGVVIDVATGDILALVSTPVFDLNRVRLDYGRLIADSKKPLFNRAINQQYPPGSVVKPLILIAAVESGKITAGETISCPAARAPGGWPNCWIYNTTHSQGHDDHWRGQGGNNYRNALKGSCNIYFSHLANRVEPSVLQRWLYNFGYGRKVLDGFSSNVTNVDRNFRQMNGQISSSLRQNIDPNTGQILPLESGERRWFGIGQGNLRATPLQVVNAMAAVARNGNYKSAKLFIDANGLPSGTTSLEISPHTLNMVRDGMRAVIEEPGGTAYGEFVYAGFAARGIRVYGKTGSTERPEHAWFSGFAIDNAGKSIAIAVVVEGGKHGSSDAAPLARDMLRYCIEAGYIGR